VAPSSLVTDDQLTAVLGGYASLVDVVVSHPERWLGLDGDPPPSAPLPVRALDSLRDGTFGETTPASPEWGKLPVDRRVRWWTSRIGASAGVAAAAPRFAGVLAERLPLQAALGASAAGLAVCATAREHGVTEPREWVPLLGQVLFGRDLARPGTAALTPEECEQQLSEAAEDTSEPPSTMAALGEASQRTVRTLWRLGRTLLSVPDLLARRPRGNVLYRTLAKLPVVGVAGGWLDERAGIGKAAKTTARLVEA
jgi:hypothetical protein